jgi:hypothetical protein
MGREKKERIAVCALLVCGVASVAIGLKHGPAGKWLESAGLLFDIAGIVQLDLAGLFDRIMEQFGDAIKYPFGPPSNITRQIIDDPDRPVRTWLRNTFFFESRTGLRLLVLGFAFQMAGNWLS